MTWEGQSGLILSSKKPHLRKGSFMTNMAFELGLEGESNFNRQRGEEGTIGGRDRGVKAQR